MSRMRSLAPRMVGRQVQLQALEEHLSQVRAGVCRVVLVAGEAGAGKTCLVRTFLERARAVDVVEILQGYCYEEQPPVAYGPFSSALRAFMRSHGVEPVIAAAGPLGGELLQLFPELGSPPHTPGASGDPQSRKQVLFEALSRVLRPRAERSCRIVVLEDLHWVDQTSQELLQYLTRACQAEPLLILGTYRTDEIHQRHPLGRLLARLTRDRVLHEVQIPHLPREDLGQMLEVTLDRPVPGLFVDAMADRTGGNPFFVEEVLRALLDAGQLEEAIQVARSGRADGRSIIPHSVKQSIRNRLAGVDPLAAEALRYAAVIGRQFDLELLLRLTGLEEPVLVQAVEDLVDRQIVVEERSQAGDRFSFRHALSREAIYDDMLRVDRRRRHGAVLSVLEDLYPVRVEAALDHLAYHSLQAGETAKAARYAALAGERSARLCAFREAAGHYQTALELSETTDPRERADQLQRLAGATFPLGDAAVYERCWREAQQIYAQIGDRLRSGELLSRLGHMAQDRGDFATALAHFQAAISTLEAEGPGPELATVYSEVANYHRVCFRPREGIEWAEKAQGVAAAIGDVRVEVDALITIGTTYLPLGQWGRAIEYLERSLALAKQAQLVQGTLRAYFHLGSALRHLGQFGRAVAVYEEGMALARQLGWEVRMGGDCSDAGGFALMELGHWDRAHDALDRGVRAADMGHPFARFGAAAWKAVLFLRQGSIDDARRLVEDMLPEFEARGDQAEYPDVGLALALVRQALADHDGALQAMDRAIALCCGARIVAWSSWLLQEGIEVYLGGGQDEQAQGLLPDLIALVSRWESPVAQAALAGAQGLRAVCVGKHEEAAAAFEHAATRWRELGAIYQAARSGRRRAESLLRAGGPQAREEARRELASAQEVCGRLGAAPELEAIAGIMRRHGMAAQRSTARALGLTRREREVIALLAHGCSNRIIAERLVISEKTVENHVGHILSKRGLTSRAHAAAYAVAHGLADPTPR